MVGEGGVRGATLESCITKLLFAASLLRLNFILYSKLSFSLSLGSIQLIGMSATLSNIHELSQFMNAEVYYNEFRPVSMCGRWMGDSVCS